MRHVWIIPGVLFSCHDLAMSYVYKNPNPCNRTVGDCAVRAVATALDLTWQDAFLKIVTEAYGQCDMPSSNSVITSVLKAYGFRRMEIKNPCSRFCTIQGFCKEYQKGVYVLFANNHVVTAIDGNYYDIWDSGGETIIFALYKDGA